MAEEGDDETTVTSMYRERAVDLGPWQWVTALCRATAITLILIWKTIIHIPPRTRAGSSLHEYAAYKGMLDYQSQLSPVRIQNLVTSTAKTCQRFAKRHGISFATIILPDGTVAHRLGPKEATYRVIFFHGGGYMSPAFSSQIHFAFGFADTPRKDLTVFVLQYSLVSPGANQYPRQLQQATSLLDHLIHTQNISPSSIFLIGDSAGGHLLLSLALHLKHPNPQVAPLKLDEHFAGAVIVSPWVAPFDSMGETASRLKKQDILDPTAMEHWANNFLDGAPSDHWNDPLTAPREWWRDLPLGDIFLTYGEDELLRNSGEELVVVLQYAHHATTMAVPCDGELHDHMIMNRFLSINKPCESEKEYKSWLDSHMP